MKSLTGIIFDMDGVLVDSEPVIEAAARAGLREYGVDARPEDFLPFVGAGEDRYIGGVAQKYGVEYRTEMKDRVYQIYLEIVEENIRLFPGIPELLETLRDRGYALALASSADHVKIDANLRAAGIDRALFSILLGGNDVVHKKPDPEIYRTACVGLGLDPASCLVMEDALNGVRAAKSAGCSCWGVSSSFTAEELSAAGADRILDATADLARFLGQIP